jgi:hypothetical protein
MFCEDRDMDVRTRYSGRGMYGSACFGIVCSSPIQASMELAVELVEQGGEDLAKTLANCATWDSMGRETIVYFPGVEWIEDSKENSENLDSEVAEND